MEALLIIFGILLAILVLIIVIINKIKSAFGNVPIKEIVDLAKQADLESEFQPKSVSGGDSIYLPMVLRDYPDFDNEKAKAIIQKTVSDIFSAKEVPENLKSFAKQIENSYKKATTSVKFHRITISNYKKSAESSTVFYQTAFEFRTAEKLNQLRIEAQYTLFFKEAESQESISFACESCGAPLLSFKTKKCQYCGCGISYMQNMLWKINNIYIK